MSDEYSRAVGQDILMVLYDGVDGKEYKVVNAHMKQLRMVQERSLEAYRDESIKTLKAAMEAGLVEAQERKELLQEILDKQGNWAAELASPRGVEYLGYLLLKETYPDMTLDKAGGLLNINAMDKLTQIIVDALGLDTTGGEDDASPPESQPSEQ